MEIETCLPKPLHANISSVGPDYFPDLNFKLNDWISESKYGA